MRLSILFRIDNGVIPADYRGGVISLFKRSFEIASKDTYVTLYEQNILKPFTFSIYFGNRAEIKDNKIFINNDTLILNFSTLSFELGTYFYNGLLEIKVYPLFNSKIFLKRVDLKREVQIKENVVIFKTLSPFLVRDYKDKNKYLKPADEGFSEQLNHIVSECSKTYLGREASIEFKDINTKTFPILHYGVPVDGIKGMFALKGEVEVLDLIYKIGLGSRRSQGFGMVEVVR
jgi:CRISPR-associated endoribonuclease Cas6